MLAADLAYMHGPTPNDFLLSEMDVRVAPYTNPAAERFVGRTEAEKTFSQGLEYAEWMVGMPGVLYIAQAKSIDYSMKFSFKQVGDIVLDGLAWNLELDHTDPGASLGYFGSNPPPFLECVWRFTTQLYDGRYWQMVFRRGIVMNPEDFVTGSGDWTNLPVTVRALKDDTICDTQRDVGFICVERLATPSGGYQDPCASEIPVCDPA